MDNKTFKEMIKKHQVKQSFVWFDPHQSAGPIYRFYQDTSSPDKLYCSIWSVDPVIGILQKDVVQIDRGVWQYNWHKYVDSCMNTDAYDLSYFQQMSIEAPMQQRKYWKVKADTVLFMLKDQRISRSKA